MAGMPLRTKSGAPSAAARKQYGMDDGSFPVFDQQSVDSALQMRSRDGNARAVINHVAKRGRQLNIPGTAEKVAAARAEERKKK